jgi:N-sulfoglucosamine sulfohydrolase
MKTIQYKFLIVFFTVLCIINGTEGFAINSESQFTLDQEQPNFIFYLADDQDQLDYGCYGNPKVMTPNVDRLAEEGLRFNNFYTAQAICAPARSQIFTGMYPVKNGCMANHIPVKSNILSITAHLKEAGYEVILAGKSHVEPDTVFNWTHYFESIDHRYLPLEEIDSYLKNVKKPFCIFITSDLPHGPYPTESNYTKEDIHRLPYNGENVPPFKPGYYQNIENDNIQLGKVLKMVDKHNLRDNSVFIYASDHGISGKWGLTEQGLKVPFIVRWPGKIKPNTTSNIVLSFVDILPTFLDIVNADIPKYIDGKSFYKTLQGSGQEINQYIYGVATRQNIRACKVFPSRMIRGKQFKYIKNFNALEVFESNLGNDPVVNEFIEIGAKSFPKIPYEELYDLSTDPYQRRNLAKDIQYTSKKEELSKALELWMISQNDFLLAKKMPLINPTLHPLDQQSKWNDVPDNLKDKLDKEVYIESHY